MEELLSRSKGELILSSSDSLSLQQKMAEQSIATQTATQVLNLYMILLWLQLEIFKAAICMLKL